MLETLKESNPVLLLAGINLIPIGVAAVSLCMERALTSGGGGDGGALPSAGEAYGDANHRQRRSARRRPAGERAQCPGTGPNYCCPH